MEELSRWEDEGGPPRQRRATDSGHSPATVDLESVVQGLTSDGPSYREVIRSADLSAGVYVIPTGAIDDQSPHTEDEIYFIVRGNALFDAEGPRAEAKPGTVLFVPARQPHRFVEIRSELVALVVFGPAEYSRSSGGRSK